MRLRRPWRQIGHTESPFAVYGRLGDAQFAEISACSYYAGFERILCRSSGKKLKINSLFRLDSFGMAAIVNNAQLRGAVITANECLQSVEK
jgi:hypothetical protein